MAHCYKVDFQATPTTPAYSYALYGSARNACRDALGYCENNIAGWEAVRDTSKKVLASGCEFVCSSNSDRCATITYEEIL